MLIKPHVDYKHVQSISEKENKSETRLRLIMVKSTRNIVIVSIKGYTCFINPKTN